MKMLHFIAIKFIFVKHEKAEPGLALAGGRAGGPPPRELRVSKPVGRGTMRDDSRLLVCRRPGL